MVEAQTDDTRIKLVEMLVAKALVSLTVLSDDIWLFYKQIALVGVTGCMIEASGGCFAVVRRDHVWRDVDTEAAPDKWT